MTISLTSRVLLAAGFCAAALPASAAPATTVKLVDASEDHASTQGVFGPGPGFSGQVRNDYHWAVTTRPDATRTVAGLLIEHRVGGEAWTTGSARRYGKDLYPLVVFSRGAQVTRAYDQPMGPFPGGTVLDVFGQVESAPFRGGVLHIEYTDGVYETVSMEPVNLAINPLPITGMTCQDSDDGATYGTRGKVTWSVGDGKTYTAEDYCMHEHLVVEGMCGGPGKKQYVNSHGPCSTGCVAGACIQGAVQLDVDAAVTPAGGGWSISITTGRARSVEYAAVLTGPAGRPGSHDLVADLTYQGKPMKTGNVKETQVLNPGRHTLLVQVGPDVAPQAQTLFLVFTDGTRLERSLPPTH